MPAVETLSQEMMEFGKECRIVTDPHSGRGGWSGVEAWGEGSVSTASWSGVNKSDPHFTLHRCLTLTLARGEL